MIYVRKYYYFQYLMLPYSQFDNTVSFQSTSSTKALHNCRVIVKHSKIQKLSASNLKNRLATSNKFLIATSKNFRSQILKIVLQFLFCRRIMTTLKNKFECLMKEFVRIIIFLYLLQNEVRYSFP